MTRPRFLADHDLNEHIVTGVVRLCPEIEFVRVRDVGLADSSDLDVLGYAARMSTCVVSHDVNTMTAAAMATIRIAGSFPGVFLVRQTTPVRIAIESLVLVWSASDRADWRNQVVFLPF
jgi:predicted nuclease of predicted toxin-antitoxin system